MLNEYTRINGSSGGGGGGGSIEYDMTINITAEYDENKGEWNTDSCVVSFGNNNDYESIVTMLTDTDNMPSINGGIKITGTFAGAPVAMTSMPTSMMAMDMGDGDQIIFTLHHIGIGDILAILVVEDDEITVSFTVLS